MRQDAQPGFARQAGNGRPAIDTQTFTVVGFLLAGSAFMKPYEANAWPKAIQQAMRAFPDLQPVCALRGLVQPVGTWENLPRESPTWSPKQLTMPARVYSLFGFNNAGDHEELHAIRAVDWILAAHQAMRSLGTVYQFVAAAEGMVQVVGTWTMLKESVTALERGDPDRAGASEIGAEASP